MSFEVAVINGRTVHEVVHGDLHRCVEKVEAAYRAHGAGQSVNPSSHFLWFPDKPSCRIIALPATLGAEFEVSGIKWIASYPENVRSGIPRASAVMVLNDRQTGYPFAFLEASIISAARTAASAVLAAQHLSRKGRRAQRLGLIGNGLIARYVYNFLMRTGWEVDNVSLFDTAPGESEKFIGVAMDRSHHREISVAPSAEALIRSSDLIVFTTVAGTPHVHGPAWFAHNPLVLHLSLRDLGEQIVLGSQNIVDDVDHVLKANTSLHLVQQKRGGDSSFIAGTLPQVLRGEVKPAADRPIVFSPFGLGVLDLAVAKWVYDEAMASGRATLLSDFFYELTR